MTIKDEELERQLAALGAKDAGADTDEQDLARLAEKQQRGNEFMRLGVYGLLAMVLVFFAPFVKQSQHSKTKKRGPKS